MRWAIPLACLAAACGSSNSGSLQGSSSFRPDTVLAVKPVHADGTVGDNLAAIYLTASSPAYSCQTLDAGFPDSGTIGGVVELLVAQSGALTDTTYPVTNGAMFYALATSSDGGLAAVGQSAPVAPPSARLQDFADSVSGSLTLTQTGNSWEGSFSATMALAGDGGLSLLAGSFYTGTVCYLNDY